MIFTGVHRTDLRKSLPLMLEKELVLRLTNKFFEGLMLLN